MLTIGTCKAIQLTTEFPKAQVQNELKYKYFALARTNAWPTSTKQKKKKRKNDKHFKESIVVGKGRDDPNDGCIAIVEWDVKKFLFREKEQ